MIIDPVAIKAKVDADNMLKVLKKTVGLVEELQSCVTRYNEIVNEYTKKAADTQERITKLSTAMADVNTMEDFEAYLKSEGAETSLRYYG